MSTSDLQRDARFACQSSAARLGTAGKACHRTIVRAHMVGWKLEMNETAEVGGDKSPCARLN
ncbi:hypothetical protein F442_04557 [Phytophthora nicotianae P10297]|uniref:Uncharacterized protein n=5 Tax=Phytophthora nicotianae TaxID=4792 RepID=W2QIT7_PHYN3|nr:hypothetical protein PPTG_22410 [Phytophthora nicotianae INRA-310]ETI52320.1 hypothetical protein F443_04516 [Phytophthora nicotianae P1569]ETM51920.1 hypothetical protein L914_04338 [Phytophthora nicotianae]ETO81087.1 hypothetical protein F444_04543 [Phytophthora nicotianae P1976]ETP50029.1 hypothetical protein F442_04557 [Phytophthora nicotianae P10297]ETN12776.1 hypothetical protein PPTG_22410 [Phytophthora nicotianae INRA-310]